MQQNLRNFSVGEPQFLELASDTSLFRQGFISGLTSTRIRIWIQQFSSIRIQAKTDPFKIYFKVRFSLNFLAQYLDQSPDFETGSVSTVKESGYILYQDRNRIHNPEFNHSKWGRIGINNRIQSKFLDWDPSKKPDSNGSGFPTPRIHFIFTRVRLWVEFWCHSGYVPTAKQAKLLKPTDKRCLLVPLL
jgi:hypothetical protein